MKVPDNPKNSIFNYTQGENKLTTKTVFAKFDIRFLRTQQQQRHQHSLAENIWTNNNNNYNYNYNYNDNYNNNNNSSNVNGISMAEEISYKREQSDWFQEREEAGTL